MSFAEHLSQRWPDIVVMTIQHAEVVLIAVGIPTAIGVRSEPPSKGTPAPAG